MHHSQEFLSICFIFSLCLVNSVNCLIDPITGFAVATLGLSAYFGYTGWPLNITSKDETANRWAYCRYYECCTNSYIRYDINGLAKDLEENLFGQHIANATILPALHSHHKNMDKSQKPLVMSFHGTPGTGKNYVADHIVKHLYKLGDQSAYVYKFMGRADFPLASKVDEYRTKLKNQITLAVRNCERSTFIFDEVDKMPQGVFESIVSLLDHRSNIEGTDFRKSIFIFLSNAGGIEISNALEHMMKQGKYREQTTIYNFEKIAEAGAFNVNGGLKNTGMISSSLIDHFIPFLPMERHHVEKCIIAEFNRFGKSPTDKEVSEIAENYVSYHGLFATFGCKRLTKKIEVLVSAFDIENGDAL